ncbi:MAG: DUF4860 domain-containing protein [Blautia sp.]|nr:DUF4860 domain-containing protein [Blautia sp.]
MKPSTSNDHTISNIFVFILLSMFAVFSMIVVMLGVRAYKSTRTRYETSSEYRLLSSYLRSMIRAEDGFAGVSVEEKDGQQILVLREDYGTTVCLTRIYTWDGYLREWFSREENEFRPEEGEKICRAEELRAEISDGLLTASIKDGYGKTVDVSACLYAEGIGGEYQ